MLKFICILLILKKKKFALTNESENETEKECPQREFSIPFMLLINQYDTQEHKDNRVACGTEKYKKNYNQINNLP